VSDYVTKNDHDSVKFKRDTCVSISFYSLHTSYGNHRENYDCFKRKSIHIDSHRDLAQGYVFWDDCCCQIKIMSITLSNTCVYGRLVKCSLVLSIF
jgi:hypothetical protein